ncbi:MAG TPA: hypothetical protein VMU13_01780 [Candidatus Paceibacterota bacterium]|nr:hypothetical protein [Candidatus Paceibacterota bacterium]
MKYIPLHLIGISLLFVPFTLVQAQTVTGTNFELHGPNGALTAQMTTSSDGTPALFFFDPKRVVRISIGLYPDGAPGVVLNDSTGRAAAIMRLVDTGGNPVVVLKENGADKLIIDKNGVPSGTGSTSLMLTLFIGFVGGLLGGAGAVYLVQRQKPQTLSTNPSSPV